jgi:group I intron endonuclease
MKISGIYGWYNTLTDEWYVGGSKDIFSRYRVHLKELRKGSHNGPKFLRAWKKYGPDVWFCYILETCQTQRVVLLAKEQYWMNRLDSYQNGYNTLPKAGSNLGTKWTPERRKKTLTSRAKSGWKHTEETKKLLGDIQRGVPKGPMSEAQKSKLSNIRKENPWSEERLAEISNTMKNRVYTDEIRKNMRNAHLGYVMPNQQKQAIRKANQGKSKSPAAMRNNLLARQRKGVKFSRATCKKYNIPFLD